MIKHQLEQSVFVALPLLTVIFPTLPGNESPAMLITDV